MKIKFNFLIGPLIILLVWFMISVFSLINQFFLPTPLETFKELLRLISEENIIIDILLTLKRTCLAFLIAMVIGIPTGILLGSSKKIYKHFEFVIDFFRSIPATAMFPLFLLIFGIDDKSKIAVAAFASLLIIVFNTAYGVMHIKPSRALAAKLMGATKIQLLKHIYFWESLPQIFVGLRTALSLSLVIIIVTEMFIGTYAGLGRKIIDFQYIYNIKGVYAVILLTGVIGYMINLIFLLIENKYVHWSGK
ncbi:ABC transporter permease [Candidatus Woesearchaeota archaeon]|nr:ABC transporter permease [Candidatus Woesearchaeota archaeon]